MKTLTIQKPSTTPEQQAIYDNLNKTLHEYSELVLNKTREIKEKIIIDAITNYIGRKPTTKEYKYIAIKEFEYPNNHQTKQRLYFDGFFLGTITTNYDLKDTYIQFDTKEAVEEILNSIK